MAGDTFLGKAMELLRGELGDVGDADVLLSIGLSLVSIAESLEKLTIMISPYLEQRIKLDSSSDRFR